MASHDVDCTDSQDEHVITPSEASSVRTSYKSFLQNHLAEVDSYIPSASMLQEQWSSCVWPTSDNAIRDPDTGLDADTLEQVAVASVGVPEGFVGGVIYNVKRR
jgi:probable 2-oxoglutarate dehydrogenase E1 component DHKTD1